MGATVIRGLVCDFQQAFDRGGEFRSQHVVGVVAEGVVAQAGVWGVIANLLAMATKFFHPDVIDGPFCQFDLQRLAIEVRHAARHGEGTDVHQGGNAVSVERGDEFFQRARGVADGVEGGHGSSAAAEAGSVPGYDTKDLILG